MTGLRGLAIGFVRFAGVGVIGTSAHYATLVILASFLGANAVLASSAGYVVGGIVNYLLNYRFTFRSNLSHVMTAPRFFAIALAGFFLNAAVMSLLTSTVEWHYLLAQIVATITVLLWNFLANYFWTFGSARPEH